METLHVQSHCLSGNGENAEFYNQVIKTKKLFNTFWWLNISKPHRQTLRLMQYKNRHILGHNILFNPIFYPGDI